MVKVHSKTRSTGIKVRNTRTRRKCRGSLSVFGCGTAEYGTAVSKRQLSAVRLLSAIAGGRGIFQRYGIANVEILLPPPIPVKLVRRRTFNRPGRDLSCSILYIDVIKDVRILPFQLRD